MHSMTSTVITHLLGNNGDRIPYIVADASTIAKNDVLELEDNMTVIAQTNADTPVVGIAAHEKVANDGHTEITAITNCIAKMTVVGGGDVTIGDDVSMDATNNEINTSTTLDGEKGWSIGKALETKTGGETAHIRIKK